MIISASRRTDIPSYYSDWFIKRLESGYVLTRNPMNHRQVSKILLSTDTVDCIVFWTKDPSPMLDKLAYLDHKGYSYYFQFTLTPYGKGIERNLRNKEEIIQTFLDLSKRIGKDRVLWRYDPIILNEELSIEFHKEHFKTMCQKLSGSTKLCTISFVDLYSKLRTAMKQQLLSEISEDNMREIAAAFSSIADDYGIEIRSCSEKLDLSEYGIHPASCIDKEIIEMICGHSIDVGKDKNQRMGCGCIKSVDIGVYNTCKNGCVYCYANYSDSSIEKNVSRYNPNSDILIGSIDPIKKI